MVKPYTALVVIVLILTLLPAFSIWVLVGDAWLGIVPPFTDEALYQTRVQTVVHGHFSGGNPYFLEHTDDPPLVLFGGAWLNAVPQLLGLSLIPSLALNFVFWSLLFATAAYFLLRELRISPWLSVATTVFLYIESYSHIWRSANLQTVYPFYFLFYFVLLRLIREPNRFNIVSLGLITGVTFYLFTFLWQVAVVTLGLLFLYALALRNWPLLKATSLTGLVGGTIGLPVPLYIFWLSHASPYFWESLGRLGLVNTHLPMAEVIYSGGWIGLTLALLALLWWRIPSLRGDHDARVATSFLFISGFGLWVMQGSNLITGKLTETGEHISILLQPWLVVALVTTSILAWQWRAHVALQMRWVVGVILAILLGVSVHYAYDRFIYFLPLEANREPWQTAQLYAGPYAWLETHEPEPVVVWSNPGHYFATVLPLWTKHFTLFAFWGVLNLMPEVEVRERYLISQYFNDPTAEDLKRDLAKYAGRAEAFHNAKTLERGIKICRIRYAWSPTHDCGTPQTPVELLGDEFFAKLEKAFATEIKPNIKRYLAKYQVKYLLRDKVLDLDYKPLALKASLVYEDERYELYRLP